MSETFQPSDMSAAELLDYWYEHVWDEDVDYRAIEGAIDDQGPIRGRDALRSYMQDWLDTIDDLEVSPLETIDAGSDTFVNILRVSGKIRGGDTPVVTQLALVVTLRDGKIIRGREYASREEALEAASLSGEERQ
jgi:ketosteroid isomerase-like protein